MLNLLRRRIQNDDQSMDANAPPPEPGSERPSIALALGGGAARGFAHIGVIRTLVAKGFVPDIITGTSIGAVVGGCYAAGKLDDVEAWGKTLTRRSLLSYLDLSFGGSGLLAGGRLAEKLAGALGEITIDELPIPFAAIATELRTAHEIWITHGKLIDAMRASYALPGLFPPVDIGGRWLMDGALVNPLPISAARALGARVVIAVNLNADNFGRGTIIHDHGAENVIADEVARRGLAGADANGKSVRRKLFGTAERPGLPTVMVEAFNVMQDRITRARLAGDPPDVLISPPLGKLGVFEFHRAEEAIVIGAEAAERAIESVAESVAMLT